MTVERRKYIRFLTQDNSFAKLKGVFNKVGKVNDIGISGLSFSYLRESDKTGSGSVSPRVDIYYKKEFYLTNVQCTVVYDIPENTSVRNHSSIMYRCGLYFGKLSKIQLKLLNIFINKYTTEILSS